MANAPASAMMRGNFFTRIASLPSAEPGRNVRSKAARFGQVWIAPATEI
jgi:hypothetical protein